jgi:hypothetical protein
MKKFWVLSLLIFSAACNSARKLPENPPEEPQEATEKALPTDDLDKEGLVLEVHGAAHETHQYVGTLRKPGNFFIAEQFPLVPASANVSREFSKLRRHDKIRVKGELVNPKNPQRHIRVRSLEIVKPYETELPPYHYDVKIPEELGSGGTLRAVVHAIAGEGKILLIDYRGMVLPVIIAKPEMVKDLYRSDSIEIQYSFRARPNRPPHLTLNPKVSKPLKVLYSILSEHEKSGSREGYLVLFPKSPQVIFNVFALEYQNELGLKHNYTLVNFDDGAEFARIREKLQKAWDEAPQNEVINARNRLLNRRIVVKARGKFNVQDPGQANPQIVLKSADDLEIEIR